MNAMVQQIRISLMQHTAQSFSKLLDIILLFSLNIPVHIRFILILASRSYAHLRVVFSEYIRISKHTMEDTLKFRMRGNILSALLSMCK